MSFYFYLVMLFNRCGEVPTAQLGQGGGAVFPMHTSSSLALQVEVGLGEGGDPSAGALA